MLSRLKMLLFLPVCLLGKSKLQAQEDYLKHTKVFYLCSYERECSGCFDCGKQKFWVKIKNNADKKIKGISYVFYSDVFNKIITREAKMEGYVDPKGTGKLYICVPDGKHWAITDVVYEDDSHAAFVVKDRLSSFEQEPDECDCNPTTALPNWNKE